MKFPLLRFTGVLVALSAVLCLPAGSFAEIDWEIIKKIELDDSPKDITFSRDGTTAYVLCEKDIKILFDLAALA